MFSEADVAEVRHVVQRILVPCLFVIGLLGNSVSIYVLTRKRMRCTTNIYLTALAITDIIYLTMAFMLSLKHYPYIQQHCETYFMAFGIIMWLVDACAYISIYIAVCFTIERFIAIRYPLKRQTFCTESLAKKVIAGVALFCLFSTISTAFEHTYDARTVLMDKSGKPCDQTLSNPNKNIYKSNLTKEREVRTIKLQLPANEERLLENGLWYGSGLGLTLPITFDTSSINDVKFMLPVQMQHYLGHRTVTSYSTDNPRQATDSNPEEVNGNLKQDIPNVVASVTKASSNSLRQKQLLTTTTTSSATEKATETTTSLDKLISRENSTSTLTTATPTESHSNLELKRIASTMEPVRRMQQSQGQEQQQQQQQQEQHHHQQRRFAEHDDQSVATLSPTDDDDDDADGGKEKFYLVPEQEQEQQQGQQMDDNNGSSFVFQKAEYCQNVTVYSNAYSSLGQNELYIHIWSLVTLFVFVLIPLVVLATFNCFLIMLVRRSKNLRGDLTNANSIRRVKRKSNSGLSTVSQENRVTVTLIAVVLLFIICQLPWAIYLIISEKMDIDPNLSTILGNFFNFLAAINAASNFFLYCVLSDKYRKTVRELITGYRHRRRHGHHYNASLYLHTPSAVTSSTSLYLNGSRRYRTSPTKLIGSGSGGGGGGDRSDIGGSNSSSNLQVTGKSCT